MFSDDSQQFLGSFSESLDHPDSPFCTAEGLSADETWNEARQEMKVLLTRLAGLSADQVEVSVEFLLEAHGEIFGGLFPDDAGRFRRDYGSWCEDGSFGVGTGSGPASESRNFVGTSPRQIETKLSKEFGRFHEARTQLINRSEAGEKPALLDATFPAGRLYARILRIHPFVDGNLRAAFVILQAGLLSLNLPAIEFDGKQREHDQALITAFEPGGRRQSYEPLTVLIGDQISPPTPQE
jgi:fido (protein-threonine AMPylation protein)